MSNTDPTASESTSSAETSRLGITLYQLADDSVFAKNRFDGTGWDWSWADWRRDWMDETSNKFAYRCLPLTIANQTGWWVYNPVGFTAVWRGQPSAGNVQILFDSNPGMWAGWINNQFGNGIITWNTPFLIKTRPAGSRLLIIGPANYFKHGIAPLTAVIESDWMTMSFTMNYKITAPNVPIRFEVGEPLFQAIPIGTNVGADLESADVTLMRLADDPATHKEYIEWSEGRTKFHQAKNRGEVKPDDWQKDYFKGRDVHGNEAATQHMTKVRAPKLKVKSGVPSIDARKA